MSSLNKSLQHISRPFPSPTSVFTRFLAAHTLIYRVFTTPALPKAKPEPFSLIVQKICIVGWERDMSAPPTHERLSDYTTDFFSTMQQFAFGFRWDLCVCVHTRRMCRENSRETSNKRAGKLRKSFGKIAPSAIIWLLALSVSLTRLWMILTTVMMQINIISLTLFVVVNESFHSYSSSALALSRRLTENEAKPSKGGQGRREGKCERTKNAEV